MAIPTPPLDYSSGRNPPPPDGSWAMFVLGTVAGVVFSAGYYALLLKLDWFARMPMALFGAIIAKVVIAISLLRLPRWRRFGIGLFASIPLAALILVGLCFVVLSKI